MLHSHIVQVLVKSRFEKHEKDIIKNTANIAFSHEIACENSTRKIDNVLTAWTMFFREYQNKGGREVKPFLYNTHVWVYLILLL